MATEQEIAREGQWTMDGRFIVPGALKWRNNAVPIVTRDENGQAQVIGYIVGIRRSGNKIYGTPSVTGAAFAIDVMSSTLDISEEEGVKVTSGEIVSAFLIPSDQYPWSDDNG